MVGEFRNEWSTRDVNNEKIGFNAAENISKECVFFEK
jgi:hypothetical protein